MTDTATHAEIGRVMQAYFDGLYHADTGMLKNVFHPDARYINLIEGDYMNKSLPEYFEMVDKRTPPAESQQARDDKIFSIETAGKKMAFVKASMTMMQREYLDFLTLSNDHYGWRIMAKVFTYTATKKEA